jgi:hypothetical protein
MPTVPRWNSCLIDDSIARRRPHDWPSFTLWSCRRPFSCPGYWGSATEHRHLHSITSILPGEVGYSGCDVGGSVGTTKEGNEVRFQKLFLVRRFYSRLITINFLFLCSELTTLQYRYFYHNAMTLAFRTSLGISKSTMINSDLIQTINNLHESFLE